MPRIAIVAALEREVEPLIRTWQTTSIEHDGRKFKVFQEKEAALVCGGIGLEAARRTTEAVIRALQPGLVVSAGFAGALDPALRVGDIVKPRTVINACDGSRLDTGMGSETLVTAPDVAGPERKQRLRDLYGASAVDMEAAAVAQGANARGVKFAAIKVVSDEANFAMPPMARFVSRDGDFRTTRFAFYVALRPWLWSSTIALARNSRKASFALSSALAKYLETAGKA